MNDKLYKKYEKIVEKLKTNGFVVNKNVSNIQFKALNTYDNYSIDVKLIVGHTFSKGNETVNLAYVVINGSNVIFYEYINDTICIYEFKLYYVHKNSIKHIGYEIDENLLGYDIDILEYEREIRNGMYRKIKYINKELYSNLILFEKAVGKFVKLVNVENIELLGMLLQIDYCYIYLTFNNIYVSKQNDKIKIEYSVDDDGYDFNKKILIVNYETGYKIIENIIDYFVKQIDEKVFNKFINHYNQNKQMVIDYIMDHIGNDNVKLYDLFKDYILNNKMYEQKYENKLYSYLLNFLYTLVVSVTVMSFILFAVIGLSDEPITEFVGFGILTFVMSSVLIVVKLKIDEFNYYKRKYEKFVGSEV